MTKYRPDSDSHEEDGLEQCLRNAHQPSDIDDAVNRDLLERALTVRAVFDGTSVAQNDAEVADETLDAALADEQEQAQAALLARALDGSALHPFAPLATALRAAYSPKEIALERALELRDAALRRHRRQAIRVVSYTSALVAAALGIVLGWSSGSVTEVRQSNADQLIVSRSVAPLLREMDQQSTATDRIDRVYSMRSRELRHNRFVVWGVR
ncbi:MAG TPA: hypothetical protein VIV60_03370 [Polyangiaceae bacterium]